MLKILNPAFHAVLDYALAALFLLAPALFGFGGAAASLAYMFGAVYIGASLLTKYPLGVAKLIPFPVHGVIEAIMAAIWIVVPWVLGFAADDAARNFYVAAGIALLGVVVLTDYRGRGTHVYKGQERRHNLVDRRQRSLAVALERRMGAFDRRGVAA